MKHANPHLPISKDNTTPVDAGLYDMVVFCHLRWGFVYQRPQHIITRFAKSHRILLIEEPIPYFEGEYQTANLIKISETLTILQPKVNSIQEIESVLPKYISQKNISIGWFYSAAFSPLIGSFNFDTIVYDCMDELSMFKGASPELVAQEKYLMAEADLVFTGGKSLYEAKASAHEHVYCFPSSVERIHFEQALNGIEVPEDIANLPKPVIGYYGVIDERVDLAMVHETAIRNPSCSFVMIGPLAKISDHDLPRASNIHYLGMRGYEVLPNYLKGFDIAMMPFALNDSTRFISPTKSLEYMAAGKPVISTAIKDVVRDYEHCVHIVDTADKFSAAIISCMENDKAELQSVYGTILDNTSWDRTVFNMEKLIKTNSLA